MERMLRWSELGESYNSTSFANVGFGAKADISSAKRHVRFGKALADIERLLA